MKSLLHISNHVNCFEWKQALEIPAAFLRQLRNDQLKRISWIKLELNHFFTGTEHSFSILSDPLSLLLGYSNFLLQRGVRLSKQLDILSCWRQTTLRQSARVESFFIEVFDLISYQCSSSTDDYHTRIHIEDGPILAQEIHASRLVHRIVNDSLHVNARFVLRVWRPDLKFGGQTLVSICRMLPVRKVSADELDVSFRIGWSNSRFDPCSQDSFVHIGRCRWMSFAFRREARLIPCDLGMHCVECLWTTGENTKQFLLDLGEMLFNAIRFPAGFEMISRWLTIMKGYIFPVRVIERLCFASISSTQSFEFAADSLLVEIEEETLAGLSVRRIAIPSTVEVIDTSCFTDRELINFCELT